MPTGSMEYKNHAVSCFYLQSETQPVYSADEVILMLGTILLIVIVLLLLGALPAWPYSRGWGYYPSGGLGLVVIVLLLMILMQRI